MLRVFSDPRCLLHGAPRGYPETPSRLARILAEIRRRGWPVDELGSHGESRSAVESLHDPAYVRRFEAAVARGDGLLDSADNPLSPGTWEASWAAVDATLHAADWVAEGADRAAFAAIRPPGHHAERAVAMGFCFFDNAAVAADYLRRRHGCERVAVLDFDVHHGNGTQHLFEERADILYASLHQFPFYPGSGARHERGTAGGEGATLNVPLPAGTDDRGYAEAWRLEVLPAVSAFRPDVLVVSAGFDAWAGDPLGGMRVTEQGFRHWGSWLRELAAGVCEGRVLSVLEGGYDLEALPLLVAGYLEALGGPAGH